MSDVESMVNKNADVRSYARQRAAAMKRARRLRKMLLCVCLLALTAICTVILAVCGAIHGLLASAVAAVSTMAGCFILGRYVEAVTRK